MATFKWSIQSVQHNITGPETGGVKTVSWECTGEEGEKTGSYSGATSVDPHKDAPGFVPYADLTQADVIAWLWNNDAQGNVRVDKDAVEASVQAQLDWVPTTENGVPWATTLES